jgi:TrmH family RNA methyltransferase
MAESGRVAKITRAVLQVASGAIPFAGGALSAIAGAWSEAEQERVNRFFEAWIRMLQDEFKEKAQTILDIMARLNLQDEAIAARVESKEFQSLLNKAFRAGVLIVTGEVFQSATLTEHPQGIAALVEAPQFTVEAMLIGPPLVVIAAGLQDPGNLGTLVRSAEAFGATGMILLPGTVSLWNAKTLRASSGSAFRLPVVTLTAEDAFATLRAHGVRIFAAVARDGNSEADLRGPSALLVGNEGSGLPDDWIAQADARITIPLPGAVESLNAAIAGSVLLYEAMRQRKIEA